IHDDMTCWFEAGDDDTRDRPLQIQVVPRPTVVEALVTIDPPAYVGQADSVLMDLGAGDVSAVPGSTATVSVRSTKPLGTTAAGDASAALAITDGSEIALRFTADDPTLVAATFEFDAAIAFRVRLVDGQGFQNRTDRLYHIQAQPDHPPEVAVLEPRAVTELTPGGSVALLIRAEDDFGLTGLDVVGRQVGSQLPLKIPLTEVMTVALAGERVLGLAEHVWNIAPFNLQPGEILVYSAQAADNYAYRGQPAQIGRSRQLRLKIISRADFDRRLRDEFALLQDRIRQAMVNQESLKDQTDAAARRAAESAPPDVETAGGLAARQARLADRVHDLSRRFQGARRRIELNPPDGQLGEPELQEQVGEMARLLAKTASGPMSAASHQLANADSSVNSDRNSRLRQAGDNQQAAIDALARTIRLMDQWGDFQELVAKIRDLLDRQQAVRTQTGEQGKRTLGQPPESLPSAEQAELRRTQRRQLQLAEETEQVLERLRRLAQRHRDKDPAGADALEYALRAALAGDLAKNMRDAAEAIQSNRTAAALIGQRTAETGLSRMLAALQERQQRQLAELAKRIEGTERALAEILRQQRELLEATVESQRLAAGQDVFRQQSGRQHTIQRNTVRLAEDMDDMQRVASPARLIREATDPMGRSKSALDQADGIAAEDHQAEAIDLLVQAALELDELARQANFEAMQRSLAVVQAKLEEIRNHQQDINEGSARLMELLATNNRLNRAENRRAAKLGRAQHALRPAVEELLPRLGEAAVYKWVLQNVLELVDRTGDALRRRRLDDTLTQDQRRIVEELDLLITALKEAARLPGPDSYAEGASSGGGGGQAHASRQSPIPGVAELLVLRTMQLNLNARTARTAADFESDSASEEQLRQLRQLGARQEQIRELTDRVTKRARSGHP
ncbi:MAG: DUF4175 family protein, partial [Planctomycetota bacterium]